MRPDTEFFIANKGNEAAGRPATNLYIKLLSPKEECCFKRVNKGNDLLYVHKASLKDLLKCVPVNLCTLDGRKLVIPITGANPGYAM